MHRMALDQQLCLGDYSTWYIDQLSPSYSHERMKEDEELNSSLIFSSGSTGIADICIDSNVVKSINEEVNSVRPFIQSIKIDQSKTDEDHVVPRRSIFQIFLSGSKSSFLPKNRFSSPMEGSLLNSIEWKKLLNWNVKSLNGEWSLLYKGSRDGFNAKDFHHFCDNKGPTITVIRTPQGKIFGGYTRVSWHSNKSHFLSDPYAFLFSFSLNSSVKYSLIDRNSKYAIWNAPNYGPTFGRGADLFVCSQCHIIEESYSKLPSSYRDPTGLSYQALAGKQQFFIEDIEIYH